MECLLYTGISRASKVCPMPLCNYKRPTFVPDFANEKITEEDFYFYEKKVRGEKIAFSMGFAVSLTEAACSEQQEWRQRAPFLAPPPAPSPDPHEASASQYQASRASTVSVSICFLYLVCASVSKTCPKVSELPMRGCSLGPGTFKIFSI